MTDTPVTTNHLEDDSADAFDVTGPQVPAGGAGDDEAAATDIDAPYGLGDDGTGIAMGTGDEDANLFVEDEPLSGDGPPDETLRSSGVQSADESQMSRPSGPVDDLAKRLDVDPSGGDVKG